MAVAPSALALVVADRQRRAAARESGRDAIGINFASFGVIIFCSRTSIAADRAV